MNRKGGCLTGTHKADGYAGFHLYRLVQKISHVVCDQHRKFHIYTGNIKYKMMDKLQDRPIAKLQTTGRV
jgi:hypothetical protein